MGTPCAPPNPAGLVDLVPEGWRAFELLMTFASLRWGAVTALTRGDLDLEKRTVRVSRQFMTVRGGIKVGPLMTLATAERRPKASPKAVGVRAEVGPRRAPRPPRDPSRATAKAEPARRALRGSPMRHGR